jgi:biopolymer transport protein ExbD
MDEEGISKINLTSLVDVSLTLVIIFMVVAPFIVQTGITVSSSKMGESKGKVAQSKNVTVKLDAKGEVRVNGRPVMWDDLADVLEKAIPKSKDKMVMVLADPRNRVRSIVQVLDTARQKGALKLAILKKK